MNKKETNHDEPSMKNNPHPVAAPYALNDIERGQLASTARECFARGDGSLAQFPRILKKVIRERVWERRALRGRVYELPNLRALITSKPLAGWNEDPKKVEALLKDDPEALAMFREEMKQELPNPDGHNQHTPGKGNNVTPTRVQKGNARAYSIARVQRECDPKTVAAVMAGKMSPNAALVKAGLRKNRQISIPLDPKEVIPKLRRAFGDEFADAVEAFISPPKRGAMAIEQSEPSTRS